MCDDATLRDGFDYVVYREAERSDNTTAAAIGLALGYSSQTICASLKRLQQGGFVNYDAASRRWRSTTRYIVQR